MARVGDGSPGDLRLSIDPIHGNCVIRRASPHHKRFCSLPAAAALPRLPAVLYFITQRLPFLIMLVLTVILLLGGSLRVRTIFKIISQTELKQKSEQLKIVKQSH